jgi:cation transport regulator
MRYGNKADLPSTIRDTLPEHAQELYLQAYLRAWDEYEEGQGYLSRETMAHQQGWTAVRHEYVQDQGTGKWHLIGAASADEGKTQGFWGKLRVLFSGRS